MRFLIFILSLLLITESSGIVDIVVKYEISSFFLTEEDGDQKEKSEENSSRETDKHLYHHQFLLRSAVEAGRKFSLFIEKEIRSGYYTLPGQPPDIIY